MAPSYIIDLIYTKTSARYLLRSNEGVLLKHPSGKMKKSFGDRSFSVAAPTFWNALPVSLQSIKCISTFKSNLKTYLFKLAIFRQSNDEESFVKQSSLIPFDLRCNGNNRFHFHLMNMSKYFSILTLTLRFIRYRYGKEKLCKFNETGIYLILEKYPSTFSKT